MYLMFFYGSEELKAQLQSDGHGCASKAWERGVY